MKRDVVTIEDLSNEEIETIFDLADLYLKKLCKPGAEGNPKISGKLAEAEDIILATLFYEPSTRTRCSFESAMFRLGGQVLTSDNPATSSAVKGETLADTVRVMEAYCDIIVLRHPLEGAARAAADYASVPVINGGDGGHEHPTQTLCDLYTLRREKGNGSLKGMNVLLWGDLKFGRTVHSLVYGLARFGANILTAPAPGLELPDHVRVRLENEFRCAPWHGNPLVNARGTPAEMLDVIYVSNESAPSLPNIAPAYDGRKIASKIDACYVTRLQKERLPSGVEGVYKCSIDFQTLRARRFEHTTILHPLPRVDELAYDLDDDSRGAYFRQAAYGVAVRMALIKFLLQFRDDTRQSKKAAIARKKDPASIEVGPLGSRRAVGEQEFVKCPNTRCISNNENERKYIKYEYVLTQKREIGRDQPLLNCVYCDHEVIPLFVASPHSGSVRKACDVFGLDWKHVKFFMNMDDVKSSRIVTPIEQTSTPVEQVSTVPLESEILTD